MKSYEPLSTELEMRLFVVAGLASTSNKDRYPNLSVLIGSHVSLYVGIFLHHCLMQEKLRA